MFGQASLDSAVSTLSCGYSQEAVVLDFYVIAIILALVTTQTTSGGLFL
jgi:hypothetical protein